MPNPKPSAALSPDEIRLLLESIALDHLFIEILETQHSDRLDFHDRFEIHGELHRETHQDQMRKLSSNLIAGHSYAP